MVATTTSRVRAMVVIEGWGRERWERWVEGVDRRGVVGSRGRTDN